MVFGFGLEGSLAVGFVSLFFLVFGAEKAVDKLTSIAAYYEVPDILIAMSVVSIGTSLPELASHLIASAGILTGSLDYQIASATVLGANIGSDVVQQTLVVGIVVLAFSFRGDTNHFRFSNTFLKKDYFPMMGTTLMTLILAWDGVLSRTDGLVLFGSFMLYMYYLYRTRHERLNQDTDESDSIRWDLIIAVTAMSAVLASAHIILNVAELLVARTGFGGSIIGVMTIGIISAFPELFTAVEGIRQKAEGISLGTLIGSNITNPLLAIGLGSLASTYWVPRPLVLWDLPMETVTAGLLLGYLLFISDRKLGYKGGLYLVCLYVFYVIIRFSFFAID